MGMAVTLQAPTPGATEATARGLAVFDLDRTVVAGSSLSLYGRAVASAGLVRRSEVVRHLLAEASFARRGERAATVERLCARLLRMSEGLDVAPLLDVADATAPVIAARAYPAARMLIDQHHRLGDIVVVLSASPGPLLRALAPFLGADATVGTEPEVVGGRLTGQLASEFCHGAAKLRRLREELPALDIRFASVYADSGSDVPLLQAAGRPVAVNPDRRLRSVARASGWPVIALQ